MLKHYIFSSSHKTNTVHYLQGCSGGGGGGDKGTELSLEDI